MPSVTSPLVWLNTFQVNDPGSVADAGNDQFDIKSVVLENGNIVMVWRSNTIADTNGQDDIALIGQMFSSTGVAIGQNQFLANVTDRSAANYSVSALSGDRFVLNFNEKTTVGGGIQEIASARRIFDTNDAGIDPLFDARLADAGSGPTNNYTPAISANPDGTFLTAWKDRDSSTGFFDVRVDRVDASNTKISTEIPFAAREQVQSMDMVRLENGNHVLVISQYDPFTVENDLHFQIMDASGALIGASQQIFNTFDNGANETSVSIAALENGGFVVAWQDDAGGDLDVRHQVFDSAGSAVSPVQFSGNTGTSDNKQAPDVAGLEGGGYVIVSRDGDADTIRLQRYDDLGVPVGTVVIVADDPLGQGFTDAPSVTALPDGRLIVTHGFFDTVGTEIDADVFATIYDPRSEANSPNDYTTHQRIGTPLGDEIVMSTEDDLIFAHDGDDVVVLMTGEALSGGKMIDGGEGTDTLSFFMSRTAAEANYSFHNVDLRSFERVSLDMDLFPTTYRFNTEQLGEGLASDAEIDGALAAGASQMFFTLDAERDADVSGLQFSEAGDYEVWVIGNEQSNEIIGTTTRGATLAGAGGNDVYRVSSPDDVVMEYADEGYDRVFVDGVSSYTLTSAVERLTFTDGSNHVAKGNALDNRLEGNSGSDRFQIDEGGADIFSGGAGRDVFDARGSDTQIRVYLNDQSLNGFATAGDSFASIETFIGSSTEGDVMRAGAGRARFSGSGGNDRLWGGNNIDYLRGDAGHDDLRGGSARDTLIGGTGNDDLYGGSDRDQFRFVEADFGQDVIHDYQDDLDYLRFFSAVATDFSDFSITGNGSNVVRVTLDSDPSNYIDFFGVGGSTITLTDTDFQFY